MKKCSTVLKTDHFQLLNNESFSALLFFGTVLMPLEGRSTVTKFKSAENKIIDQQ